MVKKRNPDSPDKNLLMHFYKQMVLLRKCELITRKLYKEGKLPGFIHLYIGEEAVAAGVCACLRKDDWITSTHRGHGHALAKRVAPKAVLAELAAKTTGCSGGRGGSMHMYDPSVGLFGTNGIVGGGLPLAVGLGISSKIRKTDQVTVCFFGDGAVNHGAFHEAVNLAGIQNAPLVFVCENNLYATCTPFRATTRNPDVADKAKAYGIPGIAVDGNDVLAVYETARKAVERARNGGGPTLIEARTYRHSGHHEGDVMFGTYRTEEELNRWLERCPLRTFRQYLLEKNLFPEAELNAVEVKIDEQLAEAAEFAMASPDPDPATANDHVFSNPVNPPLPELPANPETQVQGWLAAVRDGIAEEMRHNPNIIYFGEGIGERGGSWGQTKDLWQEFGAERVIDTPISELGFTGAAIGASASGCRAVSDLMVSDFLFDAGSQIVDQAAKLRYMSNNQIAAPVVIRSGAGTIKNTGPHHSACYHPVWAHIPGLIVAMPSNPADAKGLMKTALRGGNPVIFHEHKSLFSSKGPVPVGEYLVPFGKAEIVKPGSDITLVSCGLLLRYCIEAAEVLEKEGVSCEVIDLRTIVPLDTETIVASVMKTGKLLVVDESFSMCGLGAEISAVVMEGAFDYLDGPVGRLHTDPVIQPFAPSLENAVVVDIPKIIEAAKLTLNGYSVIPKRVKASVVAEGITFKPEFPAPVAKNIQAEPVTSVPENAALKTRPADKVTASPLPAASHQDVSSGMPGIPIIMPNQDLTVAEATVVEWLKNIGDSVKTGEPVVAVETDKAVLEIESPGDGTLAEILIPVDKVIAFGGQLGTVQPTTF